MTFRSLNPTPEQFQKIKAIWLERRFKRTGHTPAMLFNQYTKQSLYEWMNDNDRLSVYKRVAKYGNNYCL